MTSHWTYAPVAAKDDLEQGDFLIPTEGLQGVLADVHKHFTDRKYLGFLVITQTCDLTRRDAPPKAPYISIAAVRSFEATIPKLASSVAPELAPNAYPADRKGKVMELLGRVIDQNEQALGLFYLHADADLNLGESALAFLRVAVALRSEHYEVLQAARRGRLAPAFQSKLGWLVGNLYARPATPDWGDTEVGKTASKRLLRDVLDRSKIEWCDETAWKRAVAAGVAIEQLSLEERQKSLKEHRPPNHKKLGIDRVIEVARAALDLDDTRLEKLRLRLANDQALTQAFKG